MIKNYADGGRLRKLAHLGGHRVYFTLCTKLRYYPVPPLESMGIETARKLLELVQSHRAGAGKRQEREPAGGRGSLR